MTSALVAVALVFFLGHALRVPMARIRLPEALVFLALGYAVGPLTGFFPEGEWNRFATALSELSLAIVLYLAALSLSVRDAVKKYPVALLLVFLGTVTTVAVSTFFGSLFHPFPPAIFLSVCIAGFGVGPVRSFLAGHRGGTGATGIWEREAIWSEGLVAAAGLWLVAGYQTQQFDPVVIASLKAPWFGKSFAIGLGSGLVWAVLDRYVRSLTRARFANEAWWLLTFAAVGKFGYSGAFAGMALGWLQAQFAPGPRWLHWVVTDTALTEARVPAIADTVLVLTNLFWVRLGTQLKLNNLNLMLFCSMALTATFVLRYLWVQIALNPKQYSRWEAMALFASSPRGLAAMALASFPVAFPNSAPGWVTACAGTFVFLSLASSTLWVGLVSLPNTRVRAHRIFGRYKEDFGVVELNVNRQASSAEEPLAETDVSPLSGPSVELVAAPVSSAFPELKVTTPIEVDLPEDDSHEDWKEPTLTTEVDLSSLEDETGGKRKVS